MFVFLHVIYNEEMLQPLDKGYIRIWKVLKGIVELRLFTDSGFFSISIQLYLYRLFKSLNLRHFETGKRDEMNRDLGQFQNQNNFFFETFN